MLMLRRKNGEVVLIEKDEQLGKGPPDSKAAREEARGHEQPRSCATRRPHPSFRGRPRKRS
jgi:hypothetical protein